MDKNGPTREDYYNLLNNLKSDIVNGKWDGMNVSIDEHPDVSENSIRTKILFSDYYLDYVWMQGDDDNTMSLFFGTWGKPEDESTLALFEQLGAKIDYWCNNREECERNLYAWLEAEYLSKRHLTGNDYANYELNPDIYVDEYGVMYNSRSKTLIKVLNKDLEEYRIKEDTIAIFEYPFKNLTKLHTLVIPASVSIFRLDFYSNFFEGCNSLKKLVVSGDFAKYAHAILANSGVKQCNVLSPEEC